MARRKDYGLRQDERGIWHANFSVAGERIRNSTFTSDRAKAEEWCAETASRVWREKKLGEKPGIKWEDAVAAWFKEKAADGKRDLANDRDKAVILAPHLDGCWLHELTISDGGKGANINAVLDKLQAERGWKNATRNRHRSFIIAVLNTMRDDAGFNVPHIKIARRKEQRDEERSLTKGEAELFIADLYKNAIHLARPARYSLACGMRQANVMWLRWFKHRYDGKGRLWPHVTEDWSAMAIPAHRAKAGKMLTIPLNDDARETLREARDCQKHGHEKWVFTYYGTPMEQPYNTAYIAAVKRCGLEGFTWHGLRHTWTTWHLENETPIEVVQKLGGWASIHVLLKNYAHLVNRHLAKYAGNVSKQPALTPAPLRAVA